MSKSAKASNTSTPQTPPIITNKEYRKLKRKLIEQEIENQNQIILIPRAGEKTKDNNWYEIAENSALIYYYAVIQPFGEEVKFTNDENSYYEQYKTGFIVTNGETKIRLLLQKANLYQSEQSQDGYYIFKLNKTFPSQELENFKTKEQTRRQANNHIVKITFSDPELFRDLKNTAKDLHRICNNFDKLSARTNGVRIVELIDKIINNYQLLSLSKNRKQFWLAIYRDLQKLAIETQTAIHIGLIDPNDGTKITASLKPAYQKITKIVKELK